MTVADDSKSSRPPKRARLAIVTTHPIQYYAPWFRHIAAHSNLQLKVFYLWNPAATSKHDPGFQQEIAWDIPLLEGYNHEFVPNVSRSPGSSSFRGINNPALLARLNSFAPDAALLIGYRYKSIQQLIFSGDRYFPLMLRGDSHRLAGTGNSLVAPLRRVAIGRIFRRFSAMLYVGKANFEYYRVHGVREDRLFFSPHAVENERFALSEELTSQGKAWRREQGIPQDNLLVMFAGKFEEKKRPLDLLRAFSKLDQTNLALLFVGAGILERALREAAKGMARVVFAPFQNQSLMPRTYAAADLFVLPSYGNQETWGLAINEALCASKPVVVSNHVGSGPDLVVPNMNGLIFEAGNVESLAAALKEAVSDQEQLIRWGRAGQRIVSNYDFAHATQGLERALASVVTSYSNEKK